MDDLISRQAAIDEVRFGQSYITKISPDGTLEHLFDAENKALEEAVKRIEQLPPVNPAEKVGHWEWKQYDIAFPEIGNYHCSSCDAVGKNGDNYCSVCGAKMQEVKK